MVVAGCLFALKLLVATTTASVETLASFPVDGHLIPFNNQHIKGALNTCRAGRGGTSTVAGKIEQAT